MAIKDVNLLKLTEHITLGRVEWQKRIHVAYSNEFGTQDLVSFGLTLLHICFCSREL